MKASTICSTLVLAVAATAIPTANNDLEARTNKPVGEAAKSCNANQVVSCCNTKSTQTNLGGLLGTLLGGGILAGNSCSGLSLPILNILNLNPASSVCGSQNTVKCCSGSKQSGLINLDLGLQCTDIL